MRKDILDWGIILVNKYTMFIGNLFVRDVMVDFIGQTKWKLMRGYVKVSYVNSTSQAYPNFGSNRTSSRVLVEEEFINFNKN